MTEDRARLDALPTTYPRIFSDGPLPWGFEHSDGWSELLVQLCARINAILETASQASMAIKQVKEKFGTLRFYYRLHGTSDEIAAQIQHVVDLAEAASGHICEGCGRRGELQEIEGWWSTLCANCRRRRST